MFDGTMLLNLAMCYALIGQRERARDELNKILSINPFDRTVLDLMFYLETEEKWEIVKIPHFIIVCPKMLDPTVVSNLSILLENILQKLTGRLGRELAGEVLVAVDPKYSLVARVEFVNRPLSPKICLGEEHLRADTLAHELTHVLAFNYNRFMAEGLAIAMQYAIADKIVWPFPDKSISAVLRENVSGLIPLANLVGEHSDNLNYFAIEKLADLDGKMAFVQSGAVVEFIIKKFGQEKLNLLFKYFDDPSNYVHPLGAQSGIEMVLGLPFAEFERQWKTEYEIDEQKKISPAINNPPQSVLAPDLSAALDFQLGVNNYGKTSYRMDHLVELLKTGEQAYNFTLLEQTKKHFAVRAAQKDSPPRVKYFLARALFGLVNTPQGRDDANFSQCCLAAAQKQVELFLAEEANFSDAHRLLGEIFSSRIRFSGKMSVLKFGPRAEACLLKATELDPENPDAWLGLGRIKLFTPPMFGGGAKVAQEIFQKAHALAPQRSDIFSWQGMACFEAGEMQSAGEYFNKALENNPHDRLAQEMLEEIDPKNNQERRN